MYRENGNGSVVRTSQVLGVRVFLKITRAQGGLESVLAVVAANHWQVTTMSLHPSLDKEYYFIHLSLDGEGDTNGVGHSLCALPVVKCAEVSSRPADD